MTVFAYVEPQCCQHSDQHYLNIHSALDSSDILHINTNATWSMSLYRDEKENIVDTAVIALVQLFSD